MCMAVSEIGILLRSRESEVNACRIRGARRVRHGHSEWECSTQCAPCLTASFPTPRNLIGSTRLGRSTLPRTNTGSAWRSQQGCRARPRRPSGCRSAAEAYLGGPLLWTRGVEYSELLTIGVPFLSLVDAQAHSSPASYGGPAAPLHGWGAQQGKASSQGVQGGAMCARVPSRSTPAVVRSLRS